MSRSTSIEINLSAIDANLRSLKKSAGSQKLIAVVKANAYGHGAARVATHIEDTVDAFAVAFTEEAVELRESGIAAPVLVLEGPHTPSELSLSSKLDLWPVLHQAEQLEWCTNLDNPLKHAWIKVDTGMHRLGFPPSELAYVKQRLGEAQIQNTTIMSHLASAESPESDITQGQIRQWNSHCADLCDTASLHNSAATRHGITGRSHWVRVGYALYGGRIGNDPLDSELLPAMQLSSRVLAVRHVKRGEAVGYGARWVAEKDSKIATIPVGYGDGYPWAAADGTPVVVSGQVVPLAGRVSMDMITVDVTDIDTVEPGAPVVLWGDTPRVDEVAAHSGTIGYELMTRLTGRVPKHYVSS